MRIESHRQGDGFRVFMHGPGPASAQFTVSGSTALAVFVAERERTLVECGYQLQGVVERRSGGERRTAPREGPDRRRRRE